MNSKLPGQKKYGRATGLSATRKNPAGKKAKKALPNEPITWDEYKRDFMTEKERHSVDDELNADLALLDLADLRRACKLTQAQLAKKLNTSQSNVARIEAAKGATFLSVMRVAKALGLDVQFRRKGRQIWRS